MQHIVKLIPTQKVWLKIGLNRHHTRTNWRRDKPKVSPMSLMSMPNASTTWEVNWTCYEPNP